MCIGTARRLATTASSRVAARATAAGPRSTLSDRGRPLGKNGKPAKLGLDDALGGGSEDAARGNATLLGRAQSSGRNAGGSSNSRSRTTSDRQRPRDFDRNRF